MSDPKQDIKEKLLESPEIRGISEKVEYKAGDIIFKEGEEHSRFYIILEGKIAIKKQNTEGAERVISELGPGEFFGENILIGKKRKPATAQTVEPARLLAISYEDFQDLIKKDASAGIHFLLTILEVVGNRLSHGNKQILALNTLNKLMHLHQKDTSRLSQEVIEHLLILTESEDGAVLLRNPFSKTYRTAYTSEKTLNESILKEVDPRKDKVLFYQDHHYLIADLEGTGTIVLRKDAKRNAYTDEDLRLLILVAEQLSHALETSAARAEEKARKRLHEKRFEF
ncbi:cyclic nucleotide-binding domain-containing protein [Candidatus Peregrinibacteria bacterium]|nr:cyclic nucleotide-binding domain-containing protein [Candidatus Peregrinibacteria bacterium]